MTTPQQPAQSIKQALIFLLILFLGITAILVLMKLMIWLGVSRMAAEAFSGAAVCLAAGAVFWLGGLKWLNADSLKNRWYALAICLSYAGKSLVELALRLGGLGEKIADTLATTLWLVTVLMAIFWIGKTQGNKNN